MKIKLLSLALILLFCVGIAQAQDCPQVDCHGNCGRFTDNNGDGFCDFGHLSRPAATQDSTKGKDKAQPALNKNTQENNQTDTNSLQLLNENNEIDTAVITLESENKTVKSSKKYHFVPIFIATLIAYIVSTVLVKTSVWSKPTHRKIWNILLCITFLVSGLLGLLLAIFINCQYYPESYIAFLRLHVEFGIAMAIISIFHILWHLTYFKNIFKKSQTHVAAK